MVRHRGIVAGQNLSAFVLDHVVEKAALGPPCLLLGRCDPLELVELLAARATVLLSEIGAGTDQFEVCVSTVSAPAAVEDLQELGAASVCPALKRLHECETVDRYRALQREPSLPNPQHVGHARGSRGRWCGRTRHPVEPDGCTRATRVC
jgi:hypothetical protein